MTMIPGKHDSANIQRENQEELRILIAGAGTGGHLFPGIAVVERVKSLVENVRVCFVTTGRAIENTVLAERGFETVRIQAAGIKGFSITGKMRSLGLLGKGFFVSRTIIKTFRPHLVLGMGGYSSAPVILAAWMAGIPRVIHEQNRIAGITNCMLGRFSDRVYVSFLDTHIPGATGKVRHSGYPVRMEIKTGREVNETRADNNPLTILVLGGSQGARSINMAVTGALEHLQTPGDFRFIHQTGVADAPYVAGIYEEKQVDANVSAFFNNMASHYQKADLAICRAGAGTLAELAAAGLPAILVPYPHAADDHQTANAEAMAENGGAVILKESDMNPKEMARLITYYRSNPGARQKMKSNIGKKPGSGDPAGIIANDILLLTGFAAAGSTGARDKNV